MNIASGAAETDVLMAMGVRKQRHAHRGRLLRRRRRRYRCISPPAGHANDAGVVVAESGPADADSSWLDTYSWSDSVMWRALRNLTSR